MLTSTANYEITWEQLPDDFVLDDEPVDNINQPSLAAALTEAWKSMESCQRRH
jgi:hypothetical protein